MDVEKVPQEAVKVLQDNIPNLLMDFTSNTIISNC